MAVNGKALAISGTGVLFVWAGIKGYSVTGVLQDIVQGKNPKNAVANQWNAISNDSQPNQAGIADTGVTGGSNQSTLQATAATFGWTTSNGQWQALNNIEMQEAGYNLEAKNPTSDAYGEAQFINGPGEYAQYGGNSTTSAGQAVAMCNYIKDRYGDPKTAWAHEQQFGWY